MLDENLAFLLSKDIGEFVFIGAFFVDVCDLRLSASIFEQVVIRHLVSPKNHIEGRTNFAEGNSFHLYGGLCYILALEVSELNRLELTAASEKHHSPQLLNVDLFEIILVEEIYGNKKGKLGQSY